MYEKHEMNVMYFEDEDTFALLVLSGDENGDGVGPGSVKPGLSDF